ncbi:MAG: sigma 54-interacting transcriptional regulator [Myxococcales bacterium]|nr:sigma 54-interacting transcriptional regulator [Myxococcales bacterium]
MSHSPIVIIENKQRQEQNLRTGERLVIKRSLQDSVAVHGDPGRSGTMILPLDPGRSSEVFDPLTTAPIYVSSHHVSGTHAEFRQDDQGRVFVKDLGSTNGTFLKLPPWQEFELDGNFELLLGQDVLVRRQSTLWPPKVKGITNADDLIRYVRHQLGKYIDSVAIGSGSDAELAKAAGKCTKVPLPERHGFVMVQWKQATFNLDLERWLQTVVSQYNCGPSRLPEESWQFLAISPERRRVLQVARQVAASEGTVLLYGHTGVGKDVLARDIYRNSGRSKGPFIAVNCAALAGSIIESELFGHKKGSFTSADSDKKGLFEVADGGTLFLDEIGELPLDVQPKLLRVLESGLFRRVGDSGPEKYVDVRIIAATNKNLERRVQEKTFRADLLFRLEATKLVVPDLMPADVRALVQTLVPMLLLKQGGNGPVTSDEMERLMECAAQNRWPGNARQLKNLLGRYLMLRQPGLTVEQNWEAVLEMDRMAYDEDAPSAQTPTPKSNPNLMLDPPQPVPVPGPDKLKEIPDCIDHLIFLHLAREVLPANDWGALAELGRRMGMTGAGAKNRLQRLGIATDPAVDIHQIDAKIAEIKLQLHPSIGYLRSVLGI